MLVAGVHQEVEPVIVLLQFGEQHLLRRVVGPVHVVDVKLLEVADHDPAGALVVIQIARIAPRLLIRGQHGAVRLLDALAKIDVVALLLDEHVRLGNQRVDEAHVIQLHRHLIRYEIQIRYAEYALQKPVPELLRLLLFVAPIGPVLGKLLRGEPLFRIGQLHGAYSPILISTMAAPYFNTTGRKLQLPPPD